nr:MAG TPA: hypothetical protein [Caudoviricetes sp.]
MKRLQRFLVGSAKVSNIAVEFRFSIGFVRSNTDR